MTDAGDRAFATWCVMTHARSVLIRALRAWGLTRSADGLEQAASLTALKLTAMDADADVRHAIWFGPLRRDLIGAADTLHAAATFASRGDATNAAVIVIGVFTNAQSALCWRRPWRQLTWRKRRADVIASARREQAAYRAAPR